MITLCLTRQDSGWEWWMKKKKKRKVDMFRYWKAPRRPWVVCAGGRGGLGLCRGAVKGWVCVG